MKLADVFGPSDIIWQPEVINQRQLFQTLAQHAARSSGRPAKMIFNLLMKRERLGTTGVGKGIAIPHGALEDIDRFYFAFARLKQPVDVKAIDGRPVDLVFLMLAPSLSGLDHLKLLVRVSLLLRREHEKLRAAEHSEELYKLIIG